MKKILILFIILLFAFNIFGQNKPKKESNDKKDIITYEQYKKLLKEKKEKYYNKNITKMNGNLRSYFSIFYNKSTKSRVKVNVDFIFEISNINKLKSDKFNFIIKALDSLDFHYGKEVEYKKSEIFKNKEGNGVLQVRLKLEPGSYKISMNITGNNGESSNKTLKNYKVPDLDKPELILTDLISISSINEERRKMFFRRNKYFITPTIEKIFKETGKYGFYFEYYNLTTNSLYNKGKYKIKYKLYYLITDKFIGENSKVKKDVPPNGQYLTMLDINEFTPGVYKIVIEFTDLISNEKITKETYFIIKDTEAESKARLGKWKILITN